MKYKLLMSSENCKANDLFRDLIRIANYPWVYRKLNSARMHLLESCTRLEK